MKSLEEVLTEIANLNTDYEIQISSSLFFDDVHYTVTVTETSHDYCVEKVRVVEMATILDAATEALKQLLSTHDSIGVYE
jgi:hypothetical protein